MGRDDVSAQAMREQIGSCEQIWLEPRAYPEEVVLDALATLLAAYGLGSRSAEAALNNPRRGLAGWRPPPRHRALDMAADLMGLAEDLRALGSPRKRCW